MITETQLLPLLQDFEPIPLEEEPLLFDRKDAKYIFSAKNLPAILSAMQDDYRILTINTSRLFHYQTTYFDTEKGAMYLAHHSGKLNRYKVRIRKYEETNTFFLEVKFKSNKGRTIKSRISTETPDLLNNHNYNFLIQSNPYNPYNLLPAVKTSFSRITLINNENNERVTIDFNLTLKHLKNTSTHEMNSLGIIEIKNEKGKVAPVFHKMIKAGYIYMYRISKYCLGIRLLDQELKSNQYKRKLQYINQIIH